MDDYAVKATLVIDVIEAKHRAFVKVLYDRWIPDQQERDVDDNRVAFGNEEYVAAVNNFDTIASVAAQSEMMKYMGIPDDVIAKVVETSLVAKLAPASSMGLGKRVILRQGRE